MRAAAAIGETGEAQRCRDFLLELVPDDTLSVAGYDPSDPSATKGAYPNR